MTLATICDVPASTISMAVLRMWALVMLLVRGWFCGLSQLL
jgi:hypothetical protein